MTFFYYFSLSLLHNSLTCLLSSFYSSWSRPSLITVKNSQIFSSHLQVVVLRLVQNPQMPSLSSVFIEIALQQYNCLNWVHRSQSTWSIKIRQLQRTREQPGPEVDDEDDVEMTLPGLKVVITSVVEVVSVVVAVLLTTLAHTHIINTLKSVSTTISNLTYHIKVDFR